MMKGDAGRAEALRRFGSPADQAAGSTAAPKPGEWGMEHLLEPGGRGRAHAAARNGDASARRALDELRQALVELTKQDAEGGN